MSASDQLEWRVVTITFDPIKGEIVIAYSMPEGTPDVKRMRLGNFQEEARDIVRSIAFHVTP